MSPTANSLVSFFVLAALCTFGFNVIQLQLGVITLTPHNLFSIITCVASLILIFYIPIPISGWVGFLSLTLFSFISFISFAVNGGSAKLIFSYLVYPLLFLSAYSSAYWCYNYEKFVGKLASWGIISFIFFMFGYFLVDLGQSSYQSRSSLNPFAERFIPVPGPYGEFGIALMIAFFPIYTSLLINFKKDVILKALLIGVTSIFVLVSESRSTYVAFLTSLFLFHFMVSSSFVRWLISISVVFVVAFAFLLGWFDQVISIAPKSFSSRFTHAQIALNFAWENPFWGMGPVAITDLVDIKTASKNLHGFFSALFFQIGLIGPGILIFLISYQLIAAVKISQESPSLKAPLSCLTSIVVAIVVEVAFFPAFGSKYLIISLGLLAGCIGARSRSTKRKNINVVGARQRGHKNAV